MRTKQQLYFKNRKQPKSQNDPSKKVQDTLLGWRDG